jgi:outer membrane protein OmpA-like peptidoglycan-associated protein
MLFFALALLSAPDAVKVQTRPQVFADEGVPFVKVSVILPIESAVLQLHRDDGKDFAFTVPKKKGEYTFKLEQEKGTAFDYKGELEVRFKGGGVGKIPLDFRGEVVIPLMIETIASAQDIAARRFSVKANRPLEKIEMTLVSESGEKIGPQYFRPPAVATEMVVPFPETKVPVVRIDAVFSDTRGIKRTMQLFPWYVEVAHEDVNFESNKFDLPAKEEPKLVDAYGRIIDSAEKAMKFAPVKLYVVGHTDTVGPADKNLALSHKRAKTIASYFRKHGFSLPISVAGLGESALVKATPDETDEPANRRVQYVLTVDPPDLGRSVRWETF